MTADGFERQALEIERLPDRIIECVLFLSAFGRGIESILRVGDQLLPSLKRLACGGSARRGHRRHTQICDTDECRAE